jgi:hypothetical protein
MVHTLRGVLPMPRMVEEEGEDPDRRRLLEGEGGNCSDLENENRGERYDEGIGGSKASRCFVEELAKTCAGPWEVMTSPDLRESSSQMLKVTGGEWHKKPYSPGYRRRLLYVLFGSRL